MLFFILLSSVELCFDDVTVEPGSTKMSVLTGFDIFFTVTFGVEVRGHAMRALRWPVACMLPPLLPLAGGAPARSFSYQWLNPTLHLFC